MSDGGAQGPVPMGGDEPPPPIGVQLGLGSMWAPSGCAWQWMKMGTNMGPVHVLRLMTTSGVFGIALNQDDLRKFVAQALEQSSGLVLPGGP